MRKALEWVGIAVFFVWIGIGVAFVAVINLVDDATMKAWIGPYAIWVIVLGGAYFVVPSIIAMLRQAYGSGSDARG